MAQSNAERQRKHRRKIKGSVVRINLEIPVEVGSGKETCKILMDGLSAKSTLSALAKFWPLEITNRPKMSAKTIARIKVQLFCHIDKFLHFKRPRFLNL